MIEPLTSHDIRVMHEVMLERYNGKEGENDPGLIEYMAEKPFMGLDDMEYYPGLFMKAAVYMEGFATHQYFCDGNKRTSYMCAKIFLELNGYNLQLSDSLLYNITMAVAKKRISIDLLARILERHSHPFILINKEDVVPPAR